MILAKNTPCFTSKFNEIYGHASLLRRYMGVLDEDLVICGQLQHGWSTADGSIDPSPLPLYVWNKRTYAGVKKRGQDAHIIGSPLLYGNFDTEHEMSSCNLLAIPDHSTVGNRYESRYEAAKQYAEWLSEIRKTEGFVQVTVLLHYNDYFDYTTSSVFNRYGIAPVTCGSPLGSSDYLTRLVDLLRKHSIVTSNVIGTAVFYASIIKKPVFINGPIPGRYSLNGSTEIVARDSFSPEWIKSNFPTLYCGPQEAVINYDIAAEELGLVYKKTPNDLWNAVQLAYMKQA